MTAAYLIHADPDSGYGNPAGMAEYAVQVRAIVEAFDGVYHSRHKRTRVLEGDWKPEFITMIEFPLHDAVARVLRVGGVPPVARAAQGGRGTAASSSWKRADRISRPPRAPRIPGAAGTRAAGRAAAHCRVHA